METSHPTIKVYTLEDLRKIAVTAYCLPLNWDNLVMIARFDKKHSLIVTNRGEVLKTGQPLVVTLNNFSNNNGCSEADIMAAYQLLKCRYRALVAGKNRLVPTCGLHAPDLVYYNARYLEDYMRLPKEGCMLLNFRTLHFAIHVQVPACKLGFEARLKGADEVSAMHLDHLHHLMHRYGVEHEYQPLTNIYRHRDSLREISDAFQELSLWLIFVEAFKKQYGEEPSKELKADFIEGYRRSYQQKC